MKTVLLVFAVVLLLTGVACAERVDFSITNNTEMEMTELYIMSEDQKHTSENLILNKSLPVKESVIATYAEFHPEITSWDIIAYDKSGKCLFWRSLDLSNVGQIILKSEHGIVNSELIKHDVVRDKPLKMNAVQ